MFEEIIEKIYKSVIESIKDRKEKLKLKQEEMLKDPKRVSKILNNIRNEHYPYLICKGEYAYLKYLFLCEDKESFINKNILSDKPENHIKKNGSNYDEMLWGHINWETMFKDVITELSKFDTSEEFGNLFDETLVDYAPYANIKYDKLHPKYARTYIFPDKRESIRQKAIDWVYPGHDSEIELCKRTFYEKFSGKTLRELNKEFPDFISEYLHKKMPNAYSFGKRVYEIHNYLSGFVAYWQSLDGVQYGDIPNEISKKEALLREYIKYNQDQIKKLEEYQKDFYNLNSDGKLADEDDRDFSQYINMLLRD